MMLNKSFNRDLNNYILISEVKLRPALYDKTVSEYSDNNYKKRLWEEINQKIFADEWDKMDETTKEFKRSEVIKRWNNLRTCFSRELKIMRDPLQNKSKKYIYFDKLTFLLGNAEPYPGYQESPEETNMIIDTINSIERYEDETSTHTEQSNGKKIISTFDTITSIERFGDDSSNHTEKFVDNKNNASNTEKKTSKTHLKMKSNKRKSIERFVQNSINQLKEELAYNKNEVIRFDASASCSTAKALDTDADTNFALSLVPMLKLVPLQKKIDAQIELLSVLKKYTSNTRHGYNLVKYEKDDMSEQDDDSEILSLYEDES